ncbi:kinase-like domain-containing protein [Lineolata rhizophorae]|uniref:Kinase-like domain-containing protein n=1 Tax=Lineolata rhizophorae TaxID=578093 RepID=A0A6A6NNN1_9PEZI|nr:kinase-like domain-containing protein [Lineolata rhizophorae]
MATLTKGQTLRGKKWDYRIIEPIRGDGTHSAAVFKASVLSKNDSTCDPTWAVIKTALPSDGDAQQNLKREYDTYCLPEVANSPYFREMYDGIDNPHNSDTDATETTSFLALEWLDSTLADLRYADVVFNYNIMKVIIENMLSSSDVLDQLSLINLDIKPVDILLSNVDSGCPSVKIADLGLVYVDGTCSSVQPLAMRAPEVYEGQPCVDRSQTWACAATLFCWMKPGILGAAGSPHPLADEAWCIAKIRRLFPNWSPSPTDDSLQQSIFRSSERFIENPRPDLKSISSLEDEMQAIDMLPEVRDLLRYLFVTDPNQRPSAAEALASTYFQNLAKKAHACSE